MVLNYHINPIKRISSMLLGIFFGSDGKQIPVDRQPKGNRKVRGRRPGHDYYLGERPG
jgi:hypothetical protein